MNATSDQIDRRKALGLLAGAASLSLLPGTALAQSIPADTFRVSESRFGGLNFPYTPRYHFWNGYRIAWIEAGQGTAGTVLLMHGNPSWAYIYHEMIPDLVRAGYRVIAPDLIGFGRSDKPLSAGWYSYTRIEQAMTSWFLARNLTNLTFFCQDWGGLIGLRILANYPDRFARVIVSNTALPHGQPLPPAFVQWRDVISPNLPRASDALEGGTVTNLSPTDVAAYDAPFGFFEGRDTLVAMRTLPKLVPTSATSPEGARNKAAFDRLRGLNKPFLCLWGNNEPYTAEWYRIFLDNIAGTRDRGAVGRHTNQLVAGHFIQEDQGAELARRIVDFAARVT